MPSSDPSRRFEDIVAFLASDLATSFVAATDRVRDLLEREQVSNVEISEPTGISMRYFPAMSRR